MGCGARVSQMTQFRQTQILPARGALNNGWLLSSAARSCILVSMESTFVIAQSVERLVVCPAG